MDEENGKRIKDDKNRQRKVGGGSNPTLDSSEVKLFYILFYVKVYPTFDLAGFIFDVNRSQTNRWMHQLLPMLEKALDRRVGTYFSKSFELLYFQYNNLVHLQYNHIHGHSYKSTI